MRLAEDLHRTVVEEDRGVCRGSGRNLAVVGSLLAGVAGSLDRSLAVEVGSRPAGEDTGAAADPDRNHQLGHKDPAG